MVRSEVPNSTVDFGKGKRLMEIPTVYEIKIEISDSMPAELADQLKETLLSPQFEEQINNIKHPWRESVVTKLQDKYKYEYRTPEEERKYRERNPNAPTRIGASADIGGNTTYIYSSTFRFSGESELNKKKAAAGMLQHELGHSIGLTHGHSPMDDEVGHFAGFYNWIYLRGVDTRLLFPEDDEQ